MTDLRILNICFGKEGGAERFFVNLAQAFHRRGGIEQRFIIRPDRTWRRHIVEIGPTIENNYRYLSLSRWWLRAEYRRIIKDWKPDVVFAFAPRAGRLQQNVPGPLKVVRLGDFPPHLKHFRNNDMIVSNTPAITDHVKSLGWKKPAETITNFARPVKAQPISRAETDTPEGAFVVAAAGRFVNRKGLDMAIRAVARMPGTILWLMGDGEERQALEALAVKEGVADRVRMLGWVDEPVHHFAAADAVLFPSRHEPLGNVVLDAWQAGMPVVAARSEGPGWFIRDGIDGILTEIDDLDAMVAGLRALQDDDNLRQRYGAAGRERLATFFSEDAIVDAYLAAFRRELGQ
ncbi:glycosyltransferase [Gymnodinialimonas sp. 57CJ19]|uniref:glycosyltransferase n=1 Tax=Gymnodinialimonas sp. 57CJ19 TaxID=3138498 RepID=UPI0031342307